MVGRVSYVWMRMVLSFLVPVPLSVVVKVLLDTWTSAWRATLVSVSFLCLTPLRRWRCLLPPPPGVLGASPWVVRLVRAVSSALVNWVRHCPLFLMNC